MITCKDIKVGDICVWSCDENNYLDLGTKLLVTKITDRGADFSPLETIIDRYGQSFDVGSRMHFMELAGMDHLSVYKSEPIKPVNRFALILKDM